MIKTPEELTEEWKAGKLEYGWYWIKHKTRGTIPDQYIPGDDWFVSNGFCITKILAPCNYGEYKAMQEELAKLKEKIKKKEELIQCLGSNIDELDVKKMVLIIENNKLSRLLKECIYILNEYKHCFDVKHHNMTANIIDKANEVLK